MSGRREWDHVSGADARMNTAMGGEIDVRSDLSHRPNARFSHNIGRTSEGNHGAVVVRVEMQVQHTNVGDGLHDGGDTLDLAAVAAFAEIRHALDESRHGKRGQAQAQRIIL
jgi:hypothetical protein